MLVEDVGGNVGGSVVVDHVARRWELFADVCLRGCLLYMTSGVSESCVHKQGVGSRPRVLQGPHEWRVKWGKVTDLELSREGGQACRRAGVKRGKAIADVAEEELGTTHTAVSQQTTERKDYIP